MNLFAQHTFPPPLDPTVLVAKKITGEITIDGKMTELEWESATLINQFVQKAPYQGKAASFNTEVKVLYNDENLYLYAFCQDSLELYDFTAQNYLRDFDEDNNDLFGISIDGNGDKQSCFAFQVTPLGTQSDLIVWDGNRVNQNVNFIWNSKTDIAKNGWSVEMQIPLKSLRYKKGSTSLGILFYRNLRRINEQSSIPALNETNSFYRMDYSAKMLIDLPKSGVNTKLTPAITLSTNETTSDNNSKFNLNVGGDIKVTPNSNTSISATINTDFAQVDADRQLNNLTNFDIAIPEQREFFLENSNLFSIGLGGIVQPFFSRKIGLGAGGLPINIDYGLRVVNQNRKNSFGGILVQQGKDEMFDKSRFGVFRYSRSFGKIDSLNNYQQKARIGGLFTTRIDTGDSISLKSNYTGSFDGLYIVSPKLKADWMISMSNPQTGTAGYAGYGGINYTSNNFRLRYNLAFITDDYKAETGFVGRSNIIRNQFFFFPRLKQDKLNWLPDFIQAFEPDFSLTTINRADNKNLEQADLTVSPIYTDWKDGSMLILSLTQSWRVFEENFYPLGLEVQAGNYSYLRYLVNYSSNPAKNIIINLSNRGGKWFDRRLTSTSIGLDFNPNPRINFSVNYENNTVKSFVSNDERDVFHLIGSNVLLSFSERIQLSNFVQYNSANKNFSVNSRLSYRFGPDSYLYLVANLGKPNATSELTFKNFLKIKYSLQF